MRRSNDEHRSHPFRVHEWARDFDLLDVWRFPIDIEAQLPFELFPPFLELTQREMLEGRGAAAQLFRLRGLMGRLFSWDEPREAEDDPFSEVYAEPNERLAEIENATVHALLHLGRVENEDGTWSPWMAVYVKRRGRLGRFYMALIGPFRHAIVYPAMMRAVARRWPAYAAQLPAPT